MINTITLKIRVSFSFNSQGQHISRTENKNLSLWLYTWKLEITLVTIWEIWQKMRHMPILDIAHVLKQALTNKNQLIFSFLHSRADPQLCYCIAHDAGSVRDFSWCPSGCWDDPNLSKNGSGQSESGNIAANQSVNSHIQSSQSENSDSEINHSENNISDQSEDRNFESSQSENRDSNGCHSDRRLGILAAACTDGTVLVYSICHPVCDKDTDQTSTKGKRHFKQCFHFKRSELHVPTCYQCLG